jgi:hypothetical protein
VALLIATLTGCSAGSTAASEPTPTPAPSPAVTHTASPAARTTVSGCLASYRPPDPDRPVVRLAFDVHRGRRDIDGVEHITFTPDRAVRAVVWRLWANSPRPKAAGGHLTVTRLTGTHGLHDFVVHSHGTLIRAHLDSRVPAGTTITATLHFRLTLPTGADDRYGVSSHVAWWGSAFPLLAYVRGEGYATEPATALFAEATTSEEFRLTDLAVTVAAHDRVLATGTRQGRPTPVGDHRATWHFSAGSVRDVAVATGRFRVDHVTGPGGLPILVGVTTDMSDNESTIASVIRSAVYDHVARFGHFPYRRLVVAAVPDVAGGIEYPGMIYLGPNQVGDATPSHEVGHEYFYGLVGDDQARDPWLDEAFATYVEALDRGTGSYYRSLTVPADGKDRVGAPMTYWADHGPSYYRSVYVQGGAALLRARDAVGHKRWDRAIRCYVRAQAHRVSTPHALARALRDLPRARAILREVGAL